MGWHSRPQTVWGLVGTCRKIWELESFVLQNQQQSRSRRHLRGTGWRQWADSARTMATTAVRVFIVAGEPSGDAIGSRLMTSLRNISLSPVEFAGVGGPLMEMQGLHSEFPIEDISVMGTVELIPHTFRLWRRLKETVAAAVEFQPNVVVTVDAKGFSFRVLSGITDAYSRQGQRRPPTVHYVAPSFWAWKGGEEKLRNLTKIVDHMLCILPFEEAVCQANGLAATFVGHPVLEDAQSAAANGEFHGDHSWKIRGDGDYFRQCHGIDAGAAVLSVLPGSRLQEVKRMLPIFEGALNVLVENVPNLTAVIPTIESPSLVPYIKAVVEKWKVRVVMLPGASEADKYNSFAASSAGLCTSGTAVVQLLMASVPSVVAYRAHPLTEWIIRSRTKLKFISLPNILLDAAVIPEALFAQCTPRTLAFHLRLLIEDDRLQEKQRIAGAQVLRMLAPPAESPHESRRLIRNDVIRHSVLQPSRVAGLAILKLLEEWALPS